MNFKQNYKEKLATDKNNKLSAGLVAERYSSVSTIVFQLTYYQSTFNRVLMTRTLSFVPANYAYFHLDCVKNDCSDGGFDLTPVVEEMVKKKKQTEKGMLFCSGKTVPPRTSAQPGHAKLSYEITIRYGSANQEAA